MGTTRIAFLRISSTAMATTVRLSLIPAVVVAFLRISSIAMPTTARLSLIPTVVVSFPRISSIAMPTTARLSCLLAILYCSLIPSALARPPPPQTSQPGGDVPLPISARGPILTEGRNYSHVCHPDRFAALGLDMTDFPYCDRSLSYRARADSLVASLTLAEKIGQLGDNTAGVDRVGLPKYKWWSEALHGVSIVGHATYFGDVVPGATSFATTIVSAASFNETLWKAIGEVTSTEGRAMHNLGHTGLTFWSPNVNVIRDPRWGRVMETPGEDPFVVGRYGVNFVRGLQDVKGHQTAEDLDSRPLKVSSCCKHYAAYDIESWMGVDRWHFDSRVTEQDMVETFLRPFEMCVKEGDVSSVMCSFNKINGIPACADQRLLSHTIRKDWNLHGYIVSDCDSIKTIALSEKWINDTAEDAVQQGLRAGLDLDCGIYYQQYMGSAAANGKIRESDVDNALKNLIIVLMRVGYFDGNPQYDSLGKDDICTEESMELSADSARQGMVLLKNKDAVLPLHKSKYRKIALVGPHANATDAMIGNYAGTPCRYVSPLDAFSLEVAVDYAIGCDVACSNDSLIAPAVKAAEKADATIIFVGLDLNTEAEGRDRTDFVLPGNQTKLIKRVARASRGPVILVLLCAGGVDIKFAAQSPRIDAIVWAGYPGAEGGRAMADVIFGRYNPGGRLPITWYEASYVDALPMTSMPLRPVHELGYPGRTYKFYKGSTVFPFGYGLSYTTFKYTISPPPSRSVTTKLGTRQFCRTLSYRNNETIITPSCPAIMVKDAPCTEEIQFQVNVANTGSRDGSHVVLVYGIPPKEVAAAPIKQVVGFKRVFVPAGKSETVSFQLNLCKSMGIVDQSAYSVLPSGEHTIQVGHGDDAPNFPVQINFHY